MSDNKNTIPDDVFEQVLLLKSGLTSLATNGWIEDQYYQTLRKSLMSSAKTKHLLPIWIVSNIDTDSLWRHLKSIHTGSGSYQIRSEYVSDEFNPLIKSLVSSSTAINEEISYSLSRYDTENVEAAWQKALLRRHSDPEGAITSARTLLEMVCKHILDDLKSEYNDGANLPTLYKLCAESLNLSPSQHTEQQFKQILGGCHSVVEGMGSLRNKLSDAHGGGRKKIKPASRHAALTVNLAGSMAMFLIETLQAKKDASLGENHAA